MTHSIASYAKGTCSLEEMIQNLHHSHQDRKEQGVVYTPGWIVDKILDQLDLTSTDTLFEPAVGHGAFLIPALTRVTHTMTGAQALAWCQDNVQACDISPATIQDLKSILTAWFWRTFSLQVSAQDLTFVAAEDGLKQTRKFSVAFGNPPYVRFQNLAPAYRDWLGQTFTSCAKGNVDLYYAFIEDALTRADRVGFIVPNSFLHTQSGKTLRTLLAPRVDTILDFGHERVFPNASTYTCLLQCRPAGRGLYTFNPTNTTSPFKVTPDRDAPVRAILGPIATLCDAAFKVEKDARGYRAVATGLYIEPTFVRPLLKITKAWAYDPENWSSFVISPYHNAKLIAQDELKTEAPKTYAHLLQMKQKLQARDKGKTDKYEGWYAFGRAQGLTPPKSTTLLVVPGMMGGKSQPRVLDISRLPKAPHIVSGYAIDNPTQAEIDGFTGPQFQTYVAQRAQAKPGSGDTLYYTLSSWMVKGFTGEQT